MIQLQIENINVCNASCVFCPYKDQKRKHTVMSMDLFKKIIDEAAGIVLISCITITGLGEPLLDPHIYDRIAYVRKKMGNKMSIDLFTNGNLLTVDKVKRLSKAGLSLLYVSMNAINPDKRREMMGLDDYAQVEKVLDDSYASLNGDMKIIVKGIAAKDLWEGSAIDEFILRWGGSYKDGGNAFIHLEGNWAGKNYKVRTTQTTPCSRALSSIMILSDGRVCLCCQDYDGEVIFGDLNHQTLREIYVNEEFTNYRAKHMEGKRSTLQLCKDCTMV